MSETLRKLGLYFRDLDTYWRAPDETHPLAVEAGPTGRYLIDIVPRLEQGHYDRFDEQGFPVRASRLGDGFYRNYTTACSYALANWEMYLLTGDREYAGLLMKMARFFLTSAERLADGSVLLREADRQPLSAMNQGEGMSVLVRAWQYSSEQQFLDAARGCALPFTRKLDDNGVVEPMYATGLPWYEELGNRPVRHILNGMVYALWGLRDLARTTDDTLAQELFEQGLNSLDGSLSYFDREYWSNYSVGEDGTPYIASMMYHNLHVVQLTRLAQETGRERLTEYARRFKADAGSTINRLRAGLMLTQRKVGQRWSQERQPQPLARPQTYPPKRPE